MNSIARRADWANVLGWAHLCLAFAGRAQTDVLAARGVTTTLLVDADIVVSHAVTSVQQRLFRDLVFAGHRDESPTLLAGMSAYFFDWLFQAGSNDPHAERLPWLIAPEHYREVVNKAKDTFESLEEANSHFQDSEKPDITQNTDRNRVDQLTDLLHRLQQDPWARIDADLADLLVLLGVDGRERPPRVVVETLVQWLRQYGAHVIGLGRRGSDANPRLKWPDFVQSRERALIRVWRELLIPHRAPGSAAGAIDTDARVLAAMTLINENWCASKHRVVLLTGSQSVLRAVCGQRLDPTMQSEAQRTHAGGGEMSDFVFLPSQVLASSELSARGWSPPGDRLPSETELLLGEQEWSIDERRDLFEMIAMRRLGPRSEKKDFDRSAPVAGYDSDLDKSVRSAPYEEAWSKSTKVSPRLLELARYRFADYFRENVKTSMAMEHVLGELYERRRKSISEAKNKVQQAASHEQLVAQLRQLGEVREVRMRVELLELLIAAGSNRSPPLVTNQRTNRLRSAPFVDWGNHPSADILSDALANLADKSSAEEIDDQLSALKVAVYKADPSTYLLVLVFACHYARQGRWELAGNAAQFAFRLSQTSATERPRPSDIQGEEAVFLDLACQRRGAQTVEDIDKALQSLRDYQTQIRATNPRLAAARLGVERISMGMTRLFLDFFRTGELDDSVRAQANSLLREALVQLNETQVSVQVDEANRPAAVADVIDRLTVNICNLAWLTVGWSPLELGRSRSVGSKQSTFARHQEAATSEQVYSSLHTLKSNCYPPETGHREGTYFDWLSLVICALHLAPDLLNWRDESARAGVVQSLTRLQDQEVDHPYDTKRLAYALDLASKLRFP